MCAVFCGTTVHSISYDCTIVTFYLGMNERKRDDDWSN